MNYSLSILKHKGLRPHKVENPSKGLRIPLTIIPMTTIVNTFIAIIPVYCYYYYYDYYDYYYCYYCS